MPRLTPTTRIPLLAIAAASTFVASGVAYTTYGKWSSPQAVFYINPQNGDIDAASAETAVRVGMDVWRTQTNNAFEFVFGGRVNDTSTGYDRRNVVIFRNASNPDSAGAVASTYSWMSGGALTDSDIIFWDGAFRFYSGVECQGGAFIEDIAAHELGHALGLQHSSAADATMYPSYSWCSQEQRTLASDDIAGVQSLYPGGGGSGSGGNSAPTVTIATPSNNSVHSAGTLISFSGSANDSEQGNLSSQLAWTSSIEGPIGTGSGFGRTLVAGTHTIRAEVMDNGGLSGVKQITVTVTAPTVGGPTLRARGYRVKGVPKADLTWDGFAAGSLDVFRNGAKVTTTPNDGSQTDTLKKGGGSYTYKLCEIGTGVCSNSVNVSF
jgi:hypothetical protein